jgi:hypothetical protein
VRFGFPVVGPIYDSIDWPAVLRTLGPRSSNALRWEQQLHRSAFSAKSSQSSISSQNQQPEPRNRQHQSFAFVLFKGWLRQAKAPIAQRLL